MTGFTTSDGAWIEYQLAGENGDSTVVLVHGASQSGVVWRSQVPLLVDAGFRCVVIDLPGHGDSSALPPPNSGRTASYDVTRYASAVGEFLTEVLGNPSILVGHSMAGGIVLQVGLNCPALVAGLVLVDSSSYSAGYSDELLSAVGLNVAGWLEVNYRALCSRSTPRERVEEVVAPLRASAADTMWNDMLAFAGLDLRPRLGELEAPIAFVHGREDWSVGVEMAQVTRGLCTNAPSRMEIIEGVGHFPQIEAPERLGPVLVDVVQWAAIGGSGEPWK